MILITLPVYNEELVLKKNVEKVLNFCLANFKDDFKIVIADNNSSDKTLIIGKESAAAHKEIDYFFTPLSGKGIAWRQVFLKYQADVYIVMDVDLAVDLTAILVLVEKISQGYDLVVGSRFLSGARVERSRLRDITSQAYRQLVQIIFKTKITDFQCGFKALNNKIKNNVLSLTQDNGFFLDTEITILSEKLGYKVVDIPVDWSEYRNQDRKSTVKIIRTILDYFYKLYLLKQKIIKLDLTKDNLFDKV